MGATIREYSPHDSLDELTGVLHRAYATLAERGMRFVASHQEVEITRQRIEAGRCFVAELEGRIVGTITTYTTTVESKCTYYLRPGVARFGQFAVDPMSQGCGVGRSLMRAAESYAREQSCHGMALDTAEGANELIDLYERWGYRIVDRVDWDATNYFSVVMAKEL